MMPTLPAPFDALLPADVLWPGAGIAAGVALACWLVMRRRRDVPPAAPRIEPALTSAVAAPAALEPAAPKRVVVAPPVLLPEGVQFGSVKVAESAESAHLTIIGTQGAGRAFAFTTLLDCLKDRGDVVVVLDEEGEFLARYFMPGRDAVLNPQDRRDVSQADDFSVERFVRNARDKFLYVTYQRSELPARAAFLASVVEEAAAALQALPAGDRRRVWLVVPDAEALGPLPQLGAALNQRLPSGGRLAIGVRQAPGLARTCGEAVADAAFSAERTLLAFRCTDATTRARLAPLLHAGGEPAAIERELAGMAQGQVLMQVAGSQTVDVFSLPMPPRYDDAAVPFEPRPAG